jgi:hypothetical protein
VRTSTTERSKEQGTLRYRVAVAATDLLDGCGPGKELDGEETKIVIFLVLRSVETVSPSSRDQRRHLEDHRSAPDGGLNGC